MVKALLFGVTILLVTVSLKSASAKNCDVCLPVYCPGESQFDECGCQKCIGCEKQCQDGFVCVGSKCEPIEHVGMLQSK